MNRSGVGYGVFSERVPFHDPFVICDLAAHEVRDANVAVCIVICFAFFETPIDLFSLSAAAAAAFSSDESRPRVNAHLCPRDKMRRLTICEHGRTLWQATHPLHTDMGEKETTK